MGSESRGGAGRLAYQGLVVDLLPDELVLAQRVACLAGDGVDGALLHLLLDGAVQHEQRLPGTLLWVQAGVGGEHRWAGPQLASPLPLLTLLSCGHKRSWVVGTGGRGQQDPSLPSPSLPLLTLLLGLRGFGAPGQVGSCSKWGGWGAPMQPWRPGSEGQLPHPSLTSQSPPRSHSHLQELVQEEGKPIGQHLLCHRLCPGEAEGMRGSPSWRAPKRVPGFLGGLSPKRTQGWEPGHCVLSRLHPSSKTQDLGPEAFAF